jgi:hypothetical protein
VTDGAFDRRTADNVFWLDRHQRTPRHGSVIAGKGLCPLIQSASPRYVANPSIRGRKERPLLGMIGWRLLGVIGVFLVQKAFSVRPE